MESMNEFNGSSVGQQIMSEDGAHVRKDGETYNQYGFRIAGLSEGNPFTLAPCLQTVYFGICKEQERDESLQEELRKELQAKKANLEAERKNKLAEIEDSQEKQKYLSVEMTELKEELSKLRHATKERNSNAWITFIISSVLLFPFSIYFFIFYSSVGYSAFFKQFGISNIAGGNFVLSQAIIDSQAIANAWNDGFAELMFILFMPFIFLAFGFVLSRWEREQGWLKYLKIPLLIVVAFGFDSLLSFEICEKIYDLDAMMQLGEIPPYSVSLALEDTTFWVIICLGFFSYLIWGFVFGFWIKALENLDLNMEKRRRMEEKIDDTKGQLESERQKCLRLHAEVSGIDPKIKEVESKMGVSTRHDIAKIKLELNNFFAGWQTYLSALGKSTAEKQEATDIFNDMISQLQPPIRYSDDEN